MKGQRKTVIDIELGKQGWAEPIKTEPKSFQTAFKEVVKEFWSLSSIHGVRYLGMNQWYERFCWIIICLTSVMFCTSQIYKSFIYWKNEPINLVLDKKFTPIDEVLFPAITFCGQRTPNQSFVNYSHILEDDDANPFDGHTLNEMKYFEYFSQLCYYSMNQAKEKLERTLKKFPPNGYLNKTEDFQFLKDLLPSGRLVVNQCTDNTEGKVNSWDCGQSFHWILLSGGVCYTFNMKPKRKILRPGVVYSLSDVPYAVQQNLSRKFSNSSDFVESRKYPFKFSNSRHYLSIRTEKYKGFEDQNCKPEVRMYVHDHDELPWDSTQAYTLRTNEYSHIRIGLKQKQVTTAPDLRSFSPQQRTCYFRDERPLKYFQYYSKSNCELECWIDKIEKECNCTPFWMPRFLNTTICRTIDMNCIHAAYAFDSCGCLSDCDLSKYTATIQNVYVAKNTDPHSTEEFNQDPLSSVFELYYIEPDILVMKRQSSQTITDFIAQIGGIFGLFLGSSILSFIEIMYFCTVRLLVKLNDSTP